MPPEVQENEFDEPPLLRDDVFDDLRPPTSTSPISQQSAHTASIFDGEDEEAEETGSSQDADLVDIEKEFPEVPRNVSEEARPQYHEPETFDLRPPPPTVTEPDAESLAARLFSAEHLSFIIKDHALFHKFTVFLNRYQPQSVPLLIKYLESQKAIAAAQYANAIAHRMSTDSPPSSGSSNAAHIDPKFEQGASHLLEMLVDEALPAYITHQLTLLVSECVVKEITGSNTPIMRDLVQGVAEVYCMTDPSQPDNPIVYCSDG